MRAAGGLTAGIVDFLANTYNTDFVPQS